MKKLSLFVAFMLFGLAFFLYVILFKFVALEMVYRFIVEGPAGLKQYLLKVARSVDITANVTYPVLFTLLFVTWRNSWSYPFGCEGNSISGVIARNHKTNDLSFIGLGLYRLLEYLDPGHGEHAINSEESCFTADK